MCGVLPAQARMTGRLTLGYRRASSGPSGGWMAGQRVSGHEFHRTVVEPRAGAVPAWVQQEQGPEGWVQDGVHASYLHVHWAGMRHVAGSFVVAATAHAGLPA